jgi:hypothetical protein
MLNPSQLHSRRVKSISNYRHTIFEKDDMAVTHTEVLVLDVLQSSPQPLPIEEIVGRLPCLSWNQVFLAVDSLSRKGLIILKRRAYDYTVSGPNYDLDRDHWSER